LHPAPDAFNIESMRDYSAFDRLLMQFDTAIRTVAGKPVVTQRPYPAAEIADHALDDSTRQHIAGLMRVNHAGEVSAQALYQGQSLTARNPELRSKLAEAAAEENDHLVWTENRIHELGSSTSLLNPIWYVGSFAIGALAGALGDKWNLGFLAETEHQVVEHLQSHLQQLPEEDARSRAILQQMQIDEAKHATTAIDHGAVVLPSPIKKLMQMMSKVMTGSAYRV
jgi:ubiquinone biosynthesis monooxygenase Coq7